MYLEEFRIGERKLRKFFDEIRVKFAKFSRRNFKGESTLSRTVSLTKKFPSTEMENREKEIGRKSADLASGGKF